MMTGAPSHSVCVVTYERPEFSTLPAFPGDDGGR